MTAKQRLARASIGMFVALGALTLSADTSISSHRAGDVITLRRDPVKIHHRRDDSSWASTNWSGYAVTGAAGSVSDVKGSWTVSSIVSTCPANAQYSSFWVGIDGFNSNSVEQIGTDSDCQNGHPVYYAWFEFYPHPSFLINNMAIHPGDVIDAEVQYLGRNAYTVSITDANTHQSFSTTTKVNAQRSSAEWIAEAPSGSGGILPLANFGTVNFTQSVATVSNHTNSLGSFGASIQELTMVSEKDGTTVKAEPSAVSGAAFSDTWFSAGP